MTQAGVYSSVLHYLQAVVASGSTTGDIVAAKMRELSIKDPIMHNASIGADGCVIHDMCLYEVKAPAQSKGLGTCLNFRPLFSHSKPFSHCLS